MEGSAIWPEFVICQHAKRTKSIWLTAPPTQFQARIYRESNYECVSNAERFLIEKFLQRTQLFNEKMMAVVSQKNLISMEVNDTISPEEMAANCINLLFV